MERYEIKQKLTEIFDKVAPIIEPKDKLFLSLVRLDHDGIIYAKTGSYIVFMNINAIEDSVLQFNDYDKQISLILHSAIVGVLSTMCAYYDGEDALNQLSSEAYHYMKRNTEQLEQLLSMDIDLGFINPMKLSSINFVKDNLGLYYSGLLTTFRDFTEEEYDLISQAENVDIIINNIKFNIIKDADYNYDFRMITSKFDNLKDMLERYEHLDISIQKSDNNKVNIIYSLQK